MTEPRRWAHLLALLSAGYPGAVLAVVSVLTATALILGSRLSMSLNMVDMLPGHSPFARSFLEVQERFGDPSIVVVLEGERDRIVEMAREVEQSLRELDVLYNVAGRAPVEFLLQRGLMLQEPGDLDRSLRSLGDPALVGSLRGLNDDFEREYTDNEENLRQDEVQVSRSMLGIHRALEVLESNLAGRPDAPPVEEAVDAFLVGEPWMLSLDRRMLLLFATPYAPFLDSQGVIEASEAVLRALAEVSLAYPDVEANLTGAGPLQKDEMDSINRNTTLLSLLALLLIYLLLAWSFRGWVVPILALAPLLMGIVWTTGVLSVLFGSLNLFTVMILLILLGLGIDFAIHLLSRYYEERARGLGPQRAVEITLSDTGVGVWTGGLTTAAAFLTLMTADTRGVFQLGVATGLGVLLTLASVFVLLPSLLVLRDRWRARRAGREPESDAVATFRTAGEGLPVLGWVALTSWRRHRWVSMAFVALVVMSVLGALRVRFEYDMLELEPPGLKNVQLQREIPRRFGVTDQGAWLVAPTVRDSRRLKEELDDLPAVGEVSAISDLVPNPEWLPDHRRKLEEFRARLSNVPGGDGGDGNAASAAELEIEVKRLWDNLDLISNLAFHSGLDRVVATVDGVTGYDSETDATDPEAVLPRLARLLAGGVDAQAARKVGVGWRTHMYVRLMAISTADSVSLGALPEMVRKTHLPRDGGEGFLLRISARDYLFDRDALNRFSEQVEEVSPSVVSTPKLAIVMMEETLRDGRNGALLALLVIALLLLVHFRGPVGLLAAVPLAGAATFMLGVMYLLGMEYNWMNLLAVPIILGIGIDDGVHALHRFRHERGVREKRVYDAFRFVGRAILLTTLTTMIGFGSLGFYSMRGIASFGIVLFLGVGLCFVTTIVVLPAVLRVFTGPADETSRQSHAPDAASLETSQVERAAADGMLDAVGAEGGRAAGDMPVASGPDSSAS